MKILAQEINQRFNWLKKPVMSGMFRSWLVDNGSLTWRLQQKYPDFFVRPLPLKYMRPLVDEASLLKVSPRRAALIREVCLTGQGQVVVFAHSVLPRSSLKGSWAGLGRLGNRPLGAALFANPRVVREPLSFRKLSPHHALYRRAARHSSGRPEFLWARRSVFRLNDAAILVTEIFLPAILNERSVLD